MTPATIATPRPAHCDRPMVRHGNLDRWAGGAVVRVERYRCPVCGHTERRYPEVTGFPTRRTKVSAVDELAMTVGYGAGLSCQTIARALGLSPATVWRVLRARGVRLRQPRVGRDG